MVPRGVYGLVDHTPWQTGSGWDLLMDFLSVATLGSLKLSMTLLAVKISKFIISALSFPVSCGEDITEFLHPITHFFYPSSPASSPPMYPLLLPSLPHP